MKNLALIPIPDVIFPSKKVHGQTIYQGLDEFTARLGTRLRDRLTEANVACSPVQRSFKPVGSAFTATTVHGGYCVTVCVELEALPKAEITVCAEPRRDAVRSWEWFEPLFRRSVESEFPDSVRWMTIDEYVESGPSV